jgi:hypothetical protein
MSSYELLELFGASVEDDPVNKVRTIRIDFAPEDGVLAEALRGGERPEWKQMLAQSANELAVLRVAQAPDANADEYGEQLFLPVARQREYVEEQRLLEEQAHRIQAEGANDGGGSLFSLWNQ